MTEAYKVDYLRFVTRLIFVAACVSAFSSGHARAAEQKAAEARKVIARVNGQPIYEDQLKPELDKSLRALQRYGTRQDDGRLAKRLQLKLLNKAIGNLLVNQESRKRTVENVEEKIDQKVKELGEKYGHGKGMERYLKIRKITMDDLRVSLKSRVRLDEYLKEQGVLEPEIPEDRIRAMYDSDPASFSRQATIAVSHILTAVDKDAEPEAKEQAKQKMERIRKEILGGKDFAAMAKEHSTCSTASRGGDLGRIKKGFMPEEFDKVAFALEKDAVSSVVESSFGFHIIKLADKDPGGVVPFEEMRAFLTKYLQDEEAKKLLQTHIVELKKKADIKILLK